MNKQFQPRLKKGQVERMRRTIDVGLIYPLVLDWLDMHKLLGEPEGKGFDTGTRDEWQKLPERQ